MTRRPIHACREAMLERIKRPEGFRSIELKAEFSQGLMQKTLGSLVRDRLAFPARMSARHVRYFGTQREAEFYQSQRRVQVRPDHAHGRVDGNARSRPHTPFNQLDAPPSKYHHAPSPMPGSGVLVSPGNLRRGGAHWNPRARPGDADYVEPHYPTDAEGRPLYRVTRGVAPQPITRSNTHAE